MAEAACATWLEDYGCDGLRFDSANDLPRDAVQVGKRSTTSAIFMLYKMAVLVTPRLILLRRSTPQAMTWSLHDLLAPSTSTMLHIAGNLASLNESRVVVLTGIHIKHVRLASQRPQAMTWSLHERFPGRILTAEVTPENPQSVHDLGFDSVWVHRRVGPADSGKSCLQ